jgi:hypothetical protein
MAKRVIRIPAVEVHVTVLPGHLQVNNGAFPVPEATVIVPFTTQGLSTGVFAGKIATS